jgi:hypothetical protein
MELLNATKMVAGYTQGLRPDGRELLVVVVKGTFDLPKNGEQAKLSAEQLPLVEADQFTGEPGFSAPLYESDYAPNKPFCDVIVNGSAHSPGGKPAQAVGVGVKVGRVAKAFNVIGDRTWESGVSGVGPGFAKPFVQKPISYDVAFGGTDRLSDDEADHDAFMPNPSGIGYRKSLTGGSLDGTPVPNTEERKNPVKSPIGNYLPMSFGPVARGWQSRAKFAGTYDDDWLENEFPFLPSDFDDRYFQCAPEDQQTDHLKGGEEVTLVNLTPDGRCEFTVPKLDVPVVFFPQDGEKIDSTAVADTLYIDTDNDRFIVLWRTHIPLRQNMFEIAQVVAGKMSRAWWRARELGKTYYPGLAAAVQAKKSNNLDDAA